MGILAYTATQAPPTTTPTYTATPGPFVLLDDFSSISTSANWLNCEVCGWQNGSLHVGPYPMEAAYEQIAIFCRECGESLHYRMSVDITFGSGQSDRGYGLLLSLNEDGLISLEVTPWQTNAVWRLDFNKQKWELLRGEYTGLLHAGTNTNHIEVKVLAGASTGRTDIFVDVNGRTVFVIYNQNLKPGRVGLTLFRHATEVIYDDFEFKTDEKPVPLQENGDLRG